MKHPIIHKLCRRDMLRNSIRALLKSSRQGFERRDSTGEEVEVETSRRAHACAVFKIGRSTNSRGLSESARPALLE